MVHGIGHDLSVNIFKNTIYQPYQFHINNNTSKTIKTYQEEASIGILHQVNQSLVLSLSISFMLLYIDLKLTIIGGSILVSFYLMISLFLEENCFNSLKISQNEELELKIYKKVSEELEKL